MKKLLLAILLTYTTNLTFGFNPIVRNFSKDIYKGGTQTWDIVQGPSGNMYFANNSGLLEFDGRNWTLRRLNNSSYARSLYLDESGPALYVGGTNELGVLTCGRTGEEYRSLLDSLDMTIPEIWDIGRDNEGNLVFRDQHAEYTLRQNGVSRVETASRRTEEVFCTAENERYYAEGTTSNGVLIRDKKTGGRIHLTTRNGLQNNTVLSMCFDSGGGLWLGLDRGIDYVMLGSPVYRLFGDADSFGTGYAAAFYKGDLYVGTSTGVFFIPAALLEGGYEDRDFKRVQGISGQTWDLQVLDGQLFCSQDKGIYIIDGGRVQGSIPLPGCWRLEPMEEGKPDHLLGSSYERFFMLEKKSGKWAFAGYLPGFDEMGRAFCRDYDGSIWFGHHINGLYRLSLNADFSAFSKVERFNTREGFPRDAGNYPFRFRGEILFATQEGFYRFDYYRGRAEAAGEFNARFTPGELNSLMFYETPDRKFKYYWSGEVQAAEYAAADGRWRMDKYSFLHLAGGRPLGFECNLALGGGKIMINAEDGFYIIDPQELENPKFGGGGKIYIKSISLKNGGQTVYTSRGGGAGKEGLRLLYKQNSFDIEFVEPSFGSNAVVYSCRLFGYDDGFSQYSPVGSKEYSKLKPGHYTFTVRSMNSQMAGRISTVSIPIVIATPWFKSWWAVLLYILLGSMLLGMAAASFRRLSKLRADRLAARQIEEMQRAQIRKDLQNKADDLAASTMNLQRKNELLQKIGAKVDDAVESAKNGDPVDVRLKRLRVISELIHENITHDTDWQKFQDNFDVVYDDFLKRLAEQFPSLSVSDKRICAYLRMGLSSKDIAPLLGMTVRSVEMTRYRLRQKLGLTREHNLSEFLQRY